MNILNRAADLVRTAGRRAAGMQPSSPVHSAKYFNSAGSGGLSALFAWRPALRDAKHDVAASYVEAAARAIDTMQNSGWIAGAVDQAVASTVGTGLRLSHLPERHALGWTEKQAAEWANLVERRWILWSENPLECDAAGKSTMAQLTRAWLKTYFAYGEGVALLPSIKRQHSTSRVKVHLVLPHRLVQDNDELQRMFQGISVDDYGFPQAYRFKRDNLMGGSVDISAFDGVGRPQVIHLFEGVAGQVRGITPLAPVLRVIRQYDQLADATLSAALIQAIFAATIESEAPTEQLLSALRDEGEQSSDGEFGDYLGVKAAWYDQTKIDLGRSGKIAHLFPGEQLKFNRSEHPNDTYEAFSKFLLREVARCLGMTFETMTGDYSGATYSSVRMATAEIWPIILSRRESICGRFLQQVFEAWLDEEIHTGRIEFIGGYNAFLANKSAACSANWKGPAKPQADDLKSAKAHEVYKRLGVTTDEQICSDLGLDWEDVYEQRALEAQKRQSLGLPDGDAMIPDPVGDGLVLEDAK